MSEQSLEQVLVKKTGQTVDLCLICNSSSEAPVVLQDLKHLFGHSLRIVSDEVKGDTVYIDKVELSGPKAGQFCLDCVKGICQKHKIRSITIVSDNDEPVEFYVEELDLAA